MERGYFVLKEKRPYPNPPPKVIVGMINGKPEMFVWIQTVYLPQ